MICVAVPCLPRSGSSMTAGILARLGLDMGPEGMNRAGRNNPLGYYEDWRFSRFHRWRSALENAGGTGWRCRLRMPPLDPRLTPEQAARYRRLVAACEAGGRSWGVKDPELAYYLPRLAEAVTCELRAVVPHRPVAEVAASIAAALGHPPGDARRAAEEYADRLRATVAGWGGPTLEFSYHDCLREPRRVVGRIADFLEVPVAEDAVAFVTPGLRHHRAP
jgi:hypothetical protein